MLTELTNKFIDEAIENEEFQYDNRLMAEKCTQISEEFAINFNIFIRQNIPIGNTLSSNQLMLEYKKYLNNK